MAWRLITPSDLHLNVSLEEPDNVPARRRRSSSSRKRLSKSETETEENEALHRLSVVEISDKEAPAEVEELEVFEDRGTTDEVSSTDNIDQCSGDSKGVSS